MAWPSLPCPRPPSPTRLDSRPGPAIGSATAGVRAGARTGHPPTLPSHGLGDERRARARPRPRPPAQNLARRSPFPRARRTRVLVARPRPPATPPQGVYITSYAKSPGLPSASLEPISPPPPNGFPPRRARSCARAHIGTRRMRSPHRGALRDEHILPPSHHAALAFGSARAGRFPRPSPAAAPRLPPKNAATKGVRRRPSLRNVTPTRAGVRSRPLQMSA